jgi:hypothetical protein
MVARLKVDVVVDFLSRVNLDEVWSSWTGLEGCVVIEIY